VKDGTFPTCCPRVVLREGLWASYLPGFSFANAHLDKDLYVTPSPRKRLLTRTRPTNPAISHSVKRMGVLIRLVSLDVSARSEGRGQWLLSFITARVDSVSIPTSVK
jgi:hypothetical protein